MKPFEGKTLFATGGASGIGAATARRFHAEGGRVAVVDLNLDAAKKVASELDGCIALACDVSDEASVAAAVAAAHEQFGRIDCVLNAAGHVDGGPAEEFSLERWNRMMAVHAGGTFLVCRAVIPLMRAIGGGSIVNIGSVAAIIARRNLGAYCAVKGAIHALTRQMALDLNDDRIRVNAVAPGPVRTGMTEKFYIERGGGDYAKGAALSSGDTIQKRVSDPSELAAPICMLLSDDGSFMTGAVVVVDGGMTVI
ncbi:SDR family oxidoreductase [Terrarubrum flagellatum]|uniref:SDR family NAD(P)-dependent oxidoreductase n=1 Tax=Terrirubrum flagellatum TaxID=2895980 RepID=UPI0031457067